MVKIIDSHCHLTELDIDLVLSRSISIIEAIVNICTDISILKKALTITQKNIYHAAAITPHDADKLAYQFDDIADILKQRKCIAIGETGLDYFYYSKTKDQQKKLLIKYLKLSQEIKLPLIFHCRDAFADLFEICDYHDQFEAVVHCFSGSYEELQEIIKRDWFFGIGGIFTFKKSQDLRQTLKRLPKKILLSHMVLETDAPFLTPHPYRSIKNEPKYILNIAESISYELDIPLEELIEKTNQNSKKLFKI